MENKDKKDQYKKDIIEILEDFINLGTQEYYQEMLKNAYKDNFKRVFDIYNNNPEFYYYMMKRDISKSYANKFIQKLRYIVSDVPEPPPAPFPNILRESPYDRKMREKEDWDKEIEEYQKERRRRLSKRNYNGRSKKSKKSKYYKRKSYIRKDGVRVRSTYVKRSK